MPCPPSSRAPDRGRHCLCLFCAAPAWLHLLCAAVCALVRELEPRPHVWAQPYPLIRAFVLYCRSLWVCSRSAEHVFSAGAQIAANKNMRAELLAAAAQSEASFTPAHCSQNHMHCTILMNSWPLRRSLKGRNACMIALSSQNNQDFARITRPKHGSASRTRNSQCRANT